MTLENDPNSPSDLGTEGGGGDPALEEDPGTDTLETPSGTPGTPSQVPQKPQRFTTPGGQDLDLDDLLRTADRYKNMRPEFDRRDSTVKKLNERIERFSDQLQTLRDERTAWLDFFRANPEIAKQAHQHLQGLNPSVLSGKMRDLEDDEPDLFQEKVDKAIEAAMAKRGFTPEAQLEHTFSTRLAAFEKSLGAKLSPEEEKKIGRDIADELEIAEAKSEDVNIDGAVDKVLHRYAISLAAHARSGKKGGPPNFTQMPGRGGSAPKGPSKKGPSKEELRDPDKRRAWARGLWDSMMGKRSR